MPQTSIRDSLKHENIEKPDAIILSGGMLGKKQRFPKALQEYDGKAVIEHQIDFLCNIVNKIVIACKKDECKLIEKHLGKMIDIEFIEEQAPLGTAGAVKNALKLTKSEKVIVCNVDNLTDIDLNALITFGPDTICLANPRLSFGVVTTNKHEISEFREKPLLRDVWVNCGLYLFDRKSIEKFPDVGSLERDVFPFSKFKAFKHIGMFKHF